MTRERMAHAWAKEMIRMFEAGKSPEEIARRFAISEERVKQILFRTSSHRPHDTLPATRKPKSEQQIRNAAMPEAERRAEMLRMRREGRTLAEIGDHFGVTRERVRQVLGADGKSEGAEQRKSKQQAQAQKRKQLEQQERAARREAELERRRIEKRERSIAVLQRAATYAYPLTGSAYDALVEQGEIAGPTRQTICLQFGSWLDACEAAGVEGGKTLRKGYDRRWTKVEMLHYVAEYRREIGRRPTAQGYAQWAKTHDGAPSGPTLRNTFGSWNNVLSELASL